MNTNNLDSKSIDPSNNTDDLIRRMVYKFESNELRTILRTIPGGIPKRVVFNSETSLRNRLLFLLDPLDPEQRSIASRKTAEAYRIRLNNETNDYERDISFLRMVHTLNSNELRSILGGIPGQDIYGTDQLLRKNLACLLRCESSKSIAQQKIEEAYNARSISPEPQQTPLVNQSCTSPSPNPIQSSNETTNETIDFAHNLPFFKTIQTLLKPRVYEAKTGVTHFHGIFYLDYIDSDLLTNSWDINKKEYNFKVILRLEEVGLKSFHGRLPCNLNISINGHQCVLPPYCGNIRLGNTITQWRQCVPMELTERTDLRPGVKNTLSISWSNEPLNYLAGLYVVQNLTGENLLVKLKKNPYRTVRRTKDLIRDTMMSEMEVGVDTITTSILDPFTKQRLKLPARGVDCKHLQCFDAKVYIQMNQQKQTWSCPVCKKHVNFENIEIDSYFYKVVHRPSLSEECENIVIFKDGSFAERQKYKFPTNSRNSFGLTNNNEIISLLDSDD